MQGHKCVMNLLKFSAASYTSESCRKKKNVIVGCNIISLFFLTYSAPDYSSSGYYRSSIQLTHMADQYCLPLDMLQFKKKKRNGRNESLNSV